MKNQSEREKWNGPIGERWVLFQEQLDAHIRVFGKHVLEKAELREGLRVLDVGAGCGDLTLDAAQAVGSTGKVVALDISKPMLARARERAKELPNVETLEEDAATFAPDAPFDLVISRFGVMFFDDPAAAFANIRGATKRGGALSFACWQAPENNPWATVPFAAVMRVLPPAEPTPPDAPGPFSLAAPRHVRDVLTRAGWADVVLTPVAHAMKLASTLDESVLFASRIGPAARALGEADEATRARALEILRETLAGLAPDFTLDAAAWIVTARA